MKVSQRYALLLAQSSAHQNSLILFFFFLVFSITVIRFWGSETDFPRDYTPQTPKEKKEGKREF